MKCIWPDCLTPKQSMLLVDAIDREDMGLSQLPEHLDLHCDKPCDMTESEILKDR